MKLVHWPLMGGLLHLVQRGGDWVGFGPAQSPPLCTSVPMYQSVYSVPITVLLYDGPLICGFNVPIKGQRVVYKRRLWHSTVSSATFQGNSQTQENILQCHSRQQTRPTYVMSLLPSIKLSLNDPHIYQQIMWLSPRHQKHRPQLS